MKKIFFLVFILLSAQTYAAVGKHNLSFKVGGGLSASELKPLSKFDGITIPEESIKASTQDLLGGAFEINLGYQFFNVTSSSLVHGIDLLAGFGMSFDTIRSIGSEKVEYLKGAYVNYNRMYGSLSSTYSIGHQFSTSKLMFDILGLNLAVGNFDMKAKALLDGSYVTQEAPAGGYFGVGINLPLGIQYIMNNGFVIGFRHSINFLLPTTNNKDGGNLLSAQTYNPTTDTYGDAKRSKDYINYSLIFSVGFMFGK